MRLDLVGQSIESQIAELQRDITEIKNRQLTSQDSGMLAHLARAQVRDQYGDVVQLSGDLGTGTTSQIQLPATPSNFELNSIYADQLFVPKHGKPAVAVPLIRLKVDSNGLKAESELFVSAQWGVKMDIKDASGAIVGSMGINQSLGGLFKQDYNANYEYAWETNMVYWSYVPFTLSYEFVVRSSDDGTTSSTLEGLWI